MLRIRLLQKDVRGFRLVYFTYNQTTYYICRQSYSATPRLMSLVCGIRLLELELDYRLVVIHVPGKVLITKGTDALSRGVVMCPFNGKDIVSPIVILFRPTTPS